MQHVDELELLSFLEWLLPGGDGSEMKIGALGVFLLIVPALSATVAFVCYLFSVARHGPSEGFYTVARTVAAGVTDIRTTTTVRRCLQLLSKRGARAGRWNC